MFNQPFRALELTMKGDSSVHWSESHGSGKNRRTVHYRSNECYMDIKVFLFGNGKDKAVIKTGSHRFPFAITLPLTLPSSFQGEHGNVIYSLKCKVDRPWKVDNKVQLMLSIVSLLDLNYQPTAMMPITATNTKTFGCLMCKSGPLTATLNAEKGGYVSGETLMFNAQIENNSNKLMTKSSIKIIESTTYKTSRKQRTWKRTVCRHDKEGIPPGGSFSWENIGLLIPPLPPSNLINCNIIDVDYVLELSVDPSGIGFDLEVVAPIIIGTIPLQQSYQYIQQGTGMLPPAYPGGQAEASAPPPPSYGETVFGGTEMEKEENNVVQGGDMFAPQYPTYNFNAPM